MRKAIRLLVRLLIEGEDEPAHDFHASTSRAVREIIRAGRASHPGLRIKVERVTEAEGEDERDEDLLRDEE